MLPLPVPVPGSWFQGLGNRAPLRYPDVTPPLLPSPPKAWNRPSCMPCPMRKAGIRVGLAVGWVPARSWNQGPGPRRGLPRQGASQGALGQSLTCSSRPFQSPLPPFPVPFVLHVVSLTPSLLQSLFLASCSPAPRTVAAHTLPGYRDKEAGAGGLGRVALILGGGWKSVYFPTPD